MRSFRSRNPIPIGLVSLTVIALAVLAAFFFDDLPIVGGGTTYSADFTEAAGLQSGDVVTVAGVKVGKVEDVSLEGDHVRVDFKVRNAWIGNQTTAAIKIKTLLGSKYVDLDPQGSGPLTPSQAIPKSRTMAPYDVLDAFSGLSRTVDNIDTDQLAQSFKVLSNTFQNTPSDVRGALDGLSRLSKTISSRDKQLATLLSNTNQISKTLADRDAEFQKLLTDGNTLLTELQIRKQAIALLLTGTQKLSTQLSGLVNDNQKQLNPVLTKLNTFTTMLQHNQDALGEGIAQLAPFARMFNNTLGNGRWFDSYVCGLLPPATSVINSEGCLGDK